jgi:hypothetical protein
VAAGPDRGDFRRDRGGLTLKPFSSLEALTIYIAASLIVVGAGELYIGRGEPNPNRCFAWKAALPPCLD